jgi:integrase/recombinase XerD
MTQLTIKELSVKVLEELQRLNYSYHSICNFRAAFIRIQAFAEEKGERYFTEDLGRQYLLEHYNCSVNYYSEACPRNAKTAMRQVRLLGDYQLHGVIIRRIVKKKDYVKPPQFEKVLTDYEIECETNQYSKRGMRTRLQRLFFFIDYLNLRKIMDVNNITPVVISDYVKTIFHHHEKSMTSILTTLRVFLRFLYTNGSTTTDLSLSVPKHTKYWYPAVPSTWKPDDVKRMLDSIDRGNPTGKRDYAILLLVAKLGIRVGDIKGLKLSHLDWHENRIHFTQQKTGSEVSFPILNDIGWAIIDYLKNGRPVSDTPYLFLRTCAPYDAFGNDANLHNIITKYTRKAGIRIPTGNRQGLHSLRHALASTMLANGTPLTVISEVLGHVNSKSTSVYLRTNMEELKQCAVDPEEVFRNE